jgi:YYY domain-containing protein
MSAIIYWYFASLLVSGAMLLPCMIIFTKSHSKGIPYARIIGSASVGLFVWFVLRFSDSQNIIAMVSIWILFSIALNATLLYLNSKLRDELYTVGPIFLRNECLWLAMFSFFLLCRYLAPDATSTEKPMDLMIVVSLFESPNVPPYDSWFSGEPMSYHYLGHLVAVIFGKIAGQDPGIIFNFALASAGASAACAVYALVGDLSSDSKNNLVRSPVSLALAGIFTVFLLFFIAPWTGLLNLLAANGLVENLQLGRWGIPNFPIESTTEFGLPTDWWWWWWTTRLFTDGFAEFPAFAFILGDPHSHLLNLPFVISFLALVILRANETDKRDSSLMRLADWAIPASFLLTTILLTNVWDFPIMICILLMFTLAKSYRSKVNLLEAIRSMLFAVFPVITSLVISIPFLMSLEPPPTGIRLVVGEHTSPTQLLMFWGPLLTVFFTFGLTTSYYRMSRSSLITMSSVITALAAIWVMILLFTGNAPELSERSLGWLTLGILLTLLMISLRQVFLGHSSQWVAWSFMAITLMLLISTEIFRLDDAFLGRVNSIFKVWFISWVLAAVASGGIGVIAVQRIFDKDPDENKLTAYLCGLAVTVVILSSTYTFAMIATRSGEMLSKTLDATAYVQRDSPMLTTAVRWVHSNLDAREHKLLHTVHESYEPGDQISTLTGIPTILTWPNHQRQWRSKVQETERRTAINSIYESASIEEAKLIAGSYGVTHVFVGSHEFNEFGINLKQRFSSWTKVFESTDGNTLIYEVPD